MISKLIVGINFKSGPFIKTLRISYLAAYQLLQNVTLLKHNIFSSLKPTKYL